MSHLREIMRKLAAGSETAVRQPAAPSTSPVLAAADYRRRLEACSAAMLHYEWAWLEQHRQDLELCAAHEAMLAVAGGARHLDELVAEAEEFLQQLREVMASRGLTPGRQPHSLVPDEHAWELSHPGIRAEWGIDTPPTPSP